MKKLIFIGAGGHFRSVFCAFKKAPLPGVKPAGIVDLPEKKGSIVSGLPVLAGDDELASLRGKADYFLISLGATGTGGKRAGLYKRCVDLGFRPCTLIASSALVAADEIRK